MAHSGRTDSSGGHNCNVGSCAGTYHYHNGGYAPTTFTYIQTPQFPINIDAIWTWSPNSNKTYDIEMELKDSDPTQYSAVISKCMGCDPGPLVDFYTNKFNFSNVKPGTWYVNVKKKINGSWSTIVYYKVDVPAWVSPTPTPTPTIIKNIPPPTASNSSDDLDSVIVLFICLFLAGSAYFGYKLIVWFLNYAKNNNWVYSILIWITLFGLIYIYSLFTDNNQSLESKNVKGPNYTCNCSKTCPNLSCAEAYFQLNNCGCSTRDGDSDGVPCEAQCR